MGARGPKKTPSQLRLLRGESRPSQINYDQPVPALREPEMPAWFDDRHAAEWRRVCAELRGMRMLFAADRDVLVAYVGAVTMHEDAMRLRMQSGVVVKGRDGGAVRNPAAMIESHSKRALQQLARDIGLSASGREDLTMPGGRPGLQAARLLS